MILIQRKENRNNFIYYLIWQNLKVHVEISGFEISFLSTISLFPVRGYGIRNVR